MKYFLLTPLFVFFFSINSIFAQELSYGFRAGLNFSTLDGPLEVGETYDYQTGFHLGVGFGWWFTDIWGVRGELLYNQKGVKRAFEGESFVNLISQTGERITFTGNRDIFVNSNNVYIDLPITGIAKVTNWLELSAGVNIGVLVNATASGELKFSDSNVDDFNLDLDYNFLRDKAGEGDGSNTKVIGSNSGHTFALPNTAGAYFEQIEDNGRYYNLFNFELVGGASFYVNRGLFLSLRAFYGLSDITNNDADFSLVENDGGDLVPRDDKDTNLTIQASIGFSF